MANNQSVRRHLDAFTRGRIIGKLEEGRSVTRTAIRWFSSGRPRGTTPADDRYIVLQARRNRQQIAGEITRHTTQATGPQISRFTVARRLLGGWSVCTTPCTVCTFNACPSEKAFSVVPGTPELRDNEWGRVLFTDEKADSV
ncbi:transposable element Tcb2 transposase [Trichonephila clavipes]|nr:transposable element Tcb2 transposase [Trichonephila clavipes]